MHLPFNKDFGNKTLVDTAIINYASSALRLNLNVATYVATYVHATYMYV